MRARSLWAVVLALSVLVAGALALVVTRPATAPPAPGADGGAAAPPSTTAITAADFLDTYVEDDGRVVRRDQGGDTVSEGQAYGMLIALLADDQARFDDVWDWTTTHLRRDDGLLSWRWQDGQVVDPASASDAEVDATRALLLAADRFDDVSYARDAEVLGDAVLEHQTVRTDDGLVLVAGEWATSPPAWFNPSYVSPVTSRLLGEATGDPRWQQLEVGSRAAVQAVSTSGQLPPNWAGIGDDGQVYPQGSPDGTGVEYGYDAARTLLRHAESCDPDDAQVAADAVRVITDNPANAGRGIAARYDLGGGPLTEDASPLTAVAQAAGLAAAGDADGAREALQLASEHQQATPTYYGDAWTVLGESLLTSTALGGCPPLPQDPEEDPA